MNNELSPEEEAEGDRGSGKVDTPETPVTVLRTSVDIYSVSLSVLAVLAVVFALHWAKVVCIPLMMGVMISYALSVPVNLMQKWHIPRAIGAAVLLLAIVAGMGAAVYSLGDEAAELIETLPEAAKKLRLTLHKEGKSSDDTMEKMQKAATEIEQAASETSAPLASLPRGVTRVQVEKPQLDVKSYLWMGTKGALGFAGQLSMIFFLAYFIMVSGDTFRRKIVKIVGPTLSKKRITIQVLDEINQQIQRFLLVRIAANILVGVVSWLAFLWIGLEHAAIWGVAAGVFNTIPYLGPMIVAGGIALVAFLQFETISMALVVTGLSLLITGLEGYLLTPWLTSRASRMFLVACCSGVGCGACGGCFWACLSSWPSRQFVIVWKI